MDTDTRTNPLAIENIRGFAADWYRALDEHAPAARCLALLCDDGLEMVFPEKTLHGLDDFMAWYAGGAYGDGSRAPGVINVFFDEIHVVQEVTVQSDGDESIVEVVVGWQASWFEPPAAKSKRTALNATQQWRVRPAAPGKNRWDLEITYYDAMLKPFDYAPGFATL